MNSQLTGQKLGSYAVGRLLGSGSMGEVYEAYDGKTALALKVLHKSLAHEERVVERFLREVRLMQVVQHPNVIPILDFGWQEGHVFLIMPLIDGATLRQIMKSRRFSPAQIWTILDPLTQGLAQAHRHGIVHRDVKPGNVLIARSDNHLYLSDFGLSKRPGLDSRITETGMVVGTPYYISPEAVVGEEMDERSDIYSLGVILYELLLNRRPFDLPDIDLTMYAHVYQPVPLPCEICPGFPQVLNQVLLTSLGKTREERYPSMEAFARAYGDALDQLSEAEANAVYGAGN
ncbi:MAG TPA: serine/threonine-protein kinase [Phototrophicaceae bacterium]|nr:serine/threonine-protein kinase [Phototrophicaceae bacterium]